MSVINFAYGRNMDFKELKERGVLFEFIGMGILENYELKFNKIALNKKGVGYANVVRSKDYKVEGLLFSIENIERLDKFEGFPNHYKKEILEIHHSGKLVRAIVYVAVSNMISNNLKPEKSYLSNLLSAKEYLSDEYYRLLKSTETFREE